MESTFDNARQLSPINSAAGSHTWYVQRFFLKYKETNQYSGQWLLDERLVGTWLNVKMEGTARAHYYGGKYEGVIGSILLEKKPTKVEQSLRLKAGYNNYHCQPRFLVPTLLQEVAARDGQPVLVIGPDVTGNDSYIGSRATVWFTGHPRSIGQVAVWIGEHVGDYVTFDEHSLCPSTPPQ